jgi:hypothetical protein
MKEYEKRGSFVTLILFTVSNITLNKYRLFAKQAEIAEFLKLFKNISTALVLLNVALFKKSLSQIHYLCAAFSCSPDPAIPKVPGSGSERPRIPPPRRLYSTSQHSQIYISRSPLVGN